MAGRHDRDRESWQKAEGMGQKAGKQTGGGVGIVEMASNTPRRRAEASTAMATY